MYLKLVFNVTLKPTKPCLVISYLIPQKRYEAVSLFHVSFVIYLLMSITRAIAFSDMMMNGQLERKQKEVVMS
jgi:hypothetical protein